ncbi:hypothetical protein BJAS_P4651 [Bathymodiolus japonicus methanotrophic gill symbiont]|uniref:hypothetical protein n=1 Tax=Bathymodiolus japonicus methanotrophic gill symbiont TaxID=113269 RepID=UPI001B4D9F67|nr:hypothetical protein [Bathymodiolus japonicus methanotrophic gill symbiont]GFO71286.1 hypothetical protein BJAS_P0657 [Bathymodiolus japonicus methanotrophic gill symbiont]GFO73689.1 hypothetical protein BJAS_P4651 [Bathymodiolus japonicus methanotrophic gill symbiont]
MKFLILVATMMLSIHANASNTDEFYTGWIDPPGDKWYSYKSSCDFSNIKSVTVMHADFPSSITSKGIEEALEECSLLIKVYYWDTYYDETEDKYFWDYKSPRILWLIKKSLNYFGTIKILPPLKEPSDTNT